MADFSYSDLSSAMTNKSILRLVVDLKPANPDGLVYPPTYAEGQHIFRPAWVDGQERNAVLLDSVQSQANRIEMAILDAHRRGLISYPDIELKVNADTGQESYSVLVLSHRVYDATLRTTSTLEGIPFSKSEIGRAIYSARADKATALFTHAPITLALGGWDSHGGGGPLVAKIPRLITSEIVGLDAKTATRGAVKFDPMDIRKDAGPIFESKDPERYIETDPAKKAPKSKEFRPSEKGFGSVPNLGPRGAVITSGLQTSLISLSAARRLRFEVDNAQRNDKRDHAGQTATVALGLFGLVAQMDTGYYLRSGCELIPSREPKLEVIGPTAENIECYSINTETAKTALDEALKVAKEQGLEWRQEKIVAEADERLITMVERSRRAATGES